MDNTIDETNKEEYKLDTVNLKDIEVFEVGKWKGVDWTIDDVNELIKNYKDGVIEPYLDIDHSEQATSEFKNALKAMSLGYVSDLKLSGKKLLANFKQVPKTIAELIQAGALKKKSSTMWKRYYSAAGREYKNVLQAVTFHGANGIPAVNTLSDFVALYKGEILKESEKTNHNIDERCEAETYQNSDMEIKGMDQVTIDKTEFERLKAVEYEMRTYKDKSAEALGELNAKKEAVESELEKLKADVVANQKAAIESEATAYVASQIKAKKIMPVSADLYKAQYIQFKNDEKLMEAFKADIENRMEMLPGQLTDNGESVAKIDYKNGDELNSAIEKRMANKKIDFKAAREEIFAELEKAGI